VIGTTDVHVPDPDVYGIEPDEVSFMLEEGEKLVPGFKQYRALRAWAGVRPLYKDQDVASDRDIPRTTNSSTTKPAMGWPGSSRSSAASGRRSA
jgi:Glycerol-3-phosphate dehydrogenase